MKKKYTLIAPLLISFLLSACGSDDNTTVTDNNSDPQTSTNEQQKINLGRMLFHDTNLSTPAGQSCATCHSRNSGFADANVSNENPVSVGADGISFGNRNAPTAAYAAFIPQFRLDAQLGYVGGQFVDGRAATLAEQAKGPFLNPNEMANSSKAEVIQKIVNAQYSTMFETVYGSGSLSNIESAYDQVADAIAAFESSTTLSPFSSKYDAVLAGNASFSAAEQRGLDLFKNENRSRCTVCHKLEPANAPLFTDFRYFNIGTPSNPFNPDTSVDIGLAGNDKLTTDANLEKGKFRTPSLRNVADTAPYMHNGVFQSLEQVMQFYNEAQIFDRQCYDPSADIIFPITCWPAPEVSENLETNEVGDLNLSQQDMDDIVAFMKTLSDGYTP